MADVTNFKSVGLENAVKFFTMKKMLKPQFFAWFARQLCPSTVDSCNRRARYRKVSMAALSLFGCAHNGMYSKGTQMLGYLSVPLVLPFGVDNSAKSRSKKLHSTSESYVSTCKRTQDDKSKELYQHTIGNSYNSHQF